MKELIFFKLFNNKEYLDWLIKDPLLFAVLIECVRRARRVKSVSPEGLNQGEFFLSRMEYQRFGLEDTQHGQIKRRLDILVKRTFIKDTGKRIGSQRSIVWILLSNQVVMPLLQVDSGIDIDRTTNNQRIGSKEDKRKTEKIRENISAERSGKKESKYKEDPIIEYCRKLQGIKKPFINYGKQLNFLKRIRDEYSDDEIEFVIEEMAEDKYWKNNPFDMAAVADKMYYYMNRTVYYDKPIRNS